MKATVIPSLLLSLLVLMTGSFATRSAETTATLRPPAVPLVTFDPYLSIWSEADHLTDQNTRHWTHRPHSLASLIRIDGVAYRLMGAQPTNVPALSQVSLQVLPTHTIYDFEGSGVHVTLTFLTTALPDDLDLFSRPLSYLTWDVRAVDGATHKVSLYDSTGSEIAVNDPSEPVGWNRSAAGPLTVLRTGTQTQRVLGSSGDDHRINWGYVYAAARADQSRAAIGPNDFFLAAFTQTGNLPRQDDPAQPRPVRRDTPVLAFIFDLGTVTAAPVQRQVIVAYDELYAIQYFGKNLRPYWRRHGQEPAGLLQAAHQEFSAVNQRCEQFDRDLVADLTRAGGRRYAEMCSLAYRECAAACGLAADAHGQPLFFTKENTSNGDIATVDVFFPMDPVWIFLSPSLAKATLVPILSYAASDHWHFPNAPHDLGTYPLAFGRDDGGEGMPVEESGNMLLLCDAVAQADGNPHFTDPWWPQLTQWAKYLEQYGLDPENQLCTDDFMGHLAHNANLSIKAILALAAYGDLCRQRGDTVTADRYFQIARTDAAHWMQAANDGDHYRLAFDKPNTWSQKYNLAWDRILGLNIFPPEVAQKEIAHYKKVMQPYGVPLDSRTHLTKTDWTLWSATLADNQADFEALISPAWDYLNQTTARDPIADSYKTDKIKSGGMHARPVVGGFFIKMLADRDLWHKWASRDTLNPSGWAPLPVPPKVTEVIPSAQSQPVTWRYTTTKPAADWTAPAFDDSAWSSGPAGFGTAGTPGAVVRTTWNTDDIWIRRTVTLPAETYSNLQFTVYHDEDIEIYVNGILAAADSGYNARYLNLPINASALAQLKPGQPVTLAAHCHQTTGGQNIDVGLVEVDEQ